MTGGSEGLPGTLPTTRTDPIPWSTRFPSGGKGKIDVWFLTDTNWIAGHGTTGTYDNLRRHVLTLEITITENLVPLTAKTQYHHKPEAGDPDGVTTCGSGDR